ncbi:MAG TPA: phospholipase A [Rhodocyclaceae bacterium]|jgi:phospholipase A1|nr:phospholipase A [Rhodocyclaceae bacterium]
MRNRALLGLGLTLNIFSLPSQAANDLNECIGIAADPVRLACYDKLAKAALPEKAVVILDSSPSAPAMLPVVVPITPPPSPVSALSERWELEPQSQAGVFQIRAHNPTYIMPLFVTSNVNRMPTSPATGRSATQDGKQKASELKFQISFKTKLMENLFDGRSDLWFGYTQQSYLQMYNAETSRDFRETNYEPELILTTKTDYNLLGWRGRFVNLGWLHQSNGRDEPLSRSWNRVYAQAGLERGDWALLVKPWWRVPEGGNDDNPDIKKYMGQGDVTVMWKRDGHVVSVLGRKSFSNDGKGAIQADWAFPLVRHLKGYMQVFSGYGESLIDYNFKQTTFGIGVALTDGL